MARRGVKKALKIIRSRRGTSISGQDFRDKTAATAIGLSLLGLGGAPVASRSIGKAVKQYTKAQRFPTGSVGRYKAYGKRVHSGAPGIKIRSTLPGGKYGKMSGSSQSTAVVSGTYAQYFERVKAGTIKPGPNLRAILKKKTIAAPEEEVFNMFRRAIRKDYKRFAKSPSKKPSTKTYPTWSVPNMVVRGTDGNLKSIHLGPYGPQKDVRSYIIPGTRDAKTQLENLYKARKKAKKLKTYSAKEARRYLNQRRTK